MKQFQTFGEYMFSLLFSPLKKARNGINQFQIFFYTVGGLFDQLRDEVFRVREEASILSASAPMLSEHGNDRAMLRYADETAEEYRLRLASKVMVAERAGTKQGVIMALRALGYSKVYIEPYYLRDPSRWAEFIVWLPPNDGSMPPVSLTSVFRETCAVKEAGAKPSFGLQMESAPIYYGAATAFIYQVDIGPKEEINE